MTTSPILGRRRLHGLQGRSLRITVRQSAQGRPPVARFAAAFVDNEGFLREGDYVEMPASDLARVARTIAGLASELRCGRR